MLGGRAFFLFPAVVQRAAVDPLVRDRFVPGAMDHATTAPTMPAGHGLFFPSPSPALRRSKWAPESHPLARVLLNI